MINKTNVFRFVLLALLLLAYQSSTIHSTQHLVKIHEDCHLCETGQKFDENLHETNFPIILESFTVAPANIEQKVVVREPLDLSQKPLVQRTDFTGMQHMAVMPTPLGYFSTAPPKNS